MRLQDLQRGGAAEDRPLEDVQQHHPQQHPPAPTGSPPLRPQAAAPGGRGGDARGWPQQHCLHATPHQTRQQRSVTTIYIGNFIIIHKLFSPFKYYLLDSLN